jgi:hypothetical protein
MKKFLLCIVLSLLPITTVLAREPLLQSKVGGSIKGTHYVCVNGLGCLNLSQIRNGRKFPLNPGPINYVYLADISNLRMYPQKLPASCQVNIGENQTLVVSGKIAKAANDDLYINNMHCAVVNE